MITIYTPINVEYRALYGLMECLKKQTCKEYVWHIVNWGKDDIDSIITDIRSVLDTIVFYDKIEAKGKYIVTDYVFRHATTPYVLGCPCEFHLKENAIESIVRQWSIIENNQLEDIAELRLLCENDTGHILGLFGSMDPNVEYCDATWHEMVLKKQCLIQAISSWHVRKFLECVKMDDYTLFSDKYNELATSLFWSSLGRKYQSRYVFTSIAIIDQSLHTNVTLPNLYNSFIANFYLFKQNIHYVGYNPVYFVRLGIHLILSGLKII